MKPSSTVLDMLEQYEAALLKWKKAKETNDVFNGGDRPEPPPTEFGLRTPQEFWAARVIRERVMGK